jgi:glycerate-2-kinase
VPDEASIVLLPDLDSSRPYCLILGGETTVTVRGDGAGGRNQELALAAALDIEGNIGVSIASFATDGEDGLLPPRQTPVAGAFVDGQTVPQAAAKGLDASDYLGRNDSYGFFQALERGHLTAERGTNVNDLLLVFKGPAE